MLFYSLILVAAAVLLLPVYIAARLLYLRGTKRETQKSREVLLALFFVYLAGVFVLVWRPGRYFDGIGSMLQSAAQRIASGYEINLLPFQTIRHYFNRIGSQAFLINILGNIFLFTPPGVGLPLLWRRWQHFGRFLCLTLCIPVLIEAVQLFLARYVDIDDVLLNTLGFVIGYLLYLLLRRLFPALRGFALPPGGTAKARKSR